MRTVYVYLFDTAADWEIGNVTAEIYSKRFFRKNSPEVCIKTVGASLKPIRTMGGLCVTPDCTTDDIDISKDTVLVLPGGNTWAEPVHGEILNVTTKLLSCGATVCAICGATTALAALGILDTHRHTSNGAGFLDMFVPAYKGASLYVDEPAVCDGNIITAAGTGATDFTKLVLEKLEVFNEDALEHWYTYFKTGNAASFYGLMEAFGK